jgi:dihydrofolate reductase
MSLDGFLTDQENQLDFFTSPTPDQNTYSDRDQLRFLETVDTILLGRKTYELFVQFWPEATTDQEVIANKLNQLDKIIFSGTLAAAPWGKWNPGLVIPGNAAAALRNLKQQPGKDMVMWGSISLAQAMIKENLIDEYRIQICPVLTGGGRRLFSEGLPFQNLILIEEKKYNTGTVFVNYRVN